MDPSTIAATRMDLGRISLVPGLTLSPWLALYPPTLHLVLSLDGIQLWDATFDLESRKARWAPSLGPFQVDLELGVDLERGEITAHGDLSLHTSSGHQIRRFDSEVVARWAPMIGRVGGGIDAHPPAVVDPAGPPSSLLPVINRIPIASTPRLGTEVGALVKQVFFSDLPDFLFNVCFAVGPVPGSGPGSYADPASRWFNVFFGYYQIDCARPDWDRPFGYRRNGGALEVDFDELVRVGKADWNYLSNWMYGVPVASISPYDGPDAGARHTLLGQRTIGASQWDFVELDGYVVVSAHQSTAAGSARLRENSLLTPLWRAAFGPQGGRDLESGSFPPTTMRARFYMASSEDAGGFHTYLFGGTVNRAFDGPDNDAFLDAQMAAGEAVIAEHYPDLGFVLG